MAVRKADIALHLYQTPQALGRRVPQQSPLQHTAKEPLEELAGDALAVDITELGQAKGQVAQGDLPPRTRQRPGQNTKRSSHSRLPAQRHALKLGKKREQQAAAPVPVGGVGRP